MSPFSRGNLSAYMGVSSGGQGLYFEPPPAYEDIVQQPATPSTPPSRPDALPSPPALPPRGPRAAVQRCFSPTLTGDGYVTEKKKEPEQPSTPQDPVAAQQTAVLRKIEQQQERSSNEEDCDTPSSSTSGIMERQCSGWGERIGGKFERLGQHIESQSEKAGETIEQGAQKLTEQFERLLNGRGTAVDKNMPWFEKRMDMMDLKMRHKQEKHSIKTRWLEEKRKHHEKWEEFRVRKEAMEKEEKRLKEELRESKKKECDEWKEFEKRKEAEWKDKMKDWKAGLKGSLDAKFKQHWMEMFKWHREHPDAGDGEGNRLSDDEEMQQIEDQPPTPAGTPTTPKRSSTDK
ncbi:unnamed protein product, partial [Mesorhabditis spiculigera]